MFHLHAFFFAAVLLTGTSLASAQGTNVAFGAIKADPNLPLEVIADNLDVNQANRSAIFTGQVVIGQGDMRLSADKVLVIYSNETSGIERMEAEGNVVLVNGPDAAESQRADYNVNTGIVVMTGDVLLTQGTSVLSSDRMTVDLADGTARLVGRVKTILQPGQN